MFKSVGIGFAFGLTFLSACSMTEYLLRVDEIQSHEMTLDTMVEKDLWRVLAEARRITESSA